MSIEDFKNGDGVLTHHDLVSDYLVNTDVYEYEISKTKTNAQTALLFSIGTETQEQGVSPTLGTGGSINLYAKIKGYWVNWAKDVNIETGFPATTIKHYAVQSYKVEITKGTDPNFVLIVTPTGKSSSS